MKKIVKAWAVLLADGFAGAYLEKDEAEGRVEFLTEVEALGWKCVPCTITYEPT